MAKHVAYVKAELLRWARTSIGLTVEEAASELGVGRDQLAEWETGYVLPSIPQLREMSRVYRRPLAAFYLSRPPTDFNVPHDFRRIPGKITPRLSPELRVELRKAQYRRQVAIDLAEVLTDLISDQIGSVTVSDDPTQVAAEVRKLLDVSIQSQFGWKDEYAALNAWKTAVEYLGVLVFHFEKVAVEEVRGFSVSDRPFPIIGINGSDSPNGRIFSLLHELCHLLLGRGGNCNFAEIDVSDADQKVEAFCNRVAGEVLVPRDAIENDQDVQQASSTTIWSDDRLIALARRFRVSTEVVLRRLLSLGRTNEAFYRAKRKEWIDVRAEKSEQTSGFMQWPNRTVRTLGQPFLRIVLGAYDREQITTSDLAEYLGVRIKHLGEIEKLLAGPNLPTGGDQ